MSYVPRTIPSLSSLSGCQGQGALTANCNVTSDVLTVQGSGFTAAAAYAYTLVLSNNVRLLFGLGQVVDDSTILLPLATMFGNQLSQLVSLNGSIFLALQTTWTLSNAFAFSIVIPHMRVVTLRALQGCSQATPFTLVDCVPGATTLWLTGLYLYSPLTLTVAKVSCPNAAISPTSIQCALPTPVASSPVWPTTLSSPAKRCQARSPCPVL